MEPKIVIIESKKFAGFHMEMSISNNRTSELWQKFMVQRGGVKNRVNRDFVSMQVYAKGQKNLFAPETQFDKWAVVEVSDYKNIPDEMETYTLNGGEYAVFIHNGPASEFSKTMENIFKNWFPDSKYELDEREHFEVLPESYNPMDPEAREEIWIPVRLKE